MDNIEYSILELARFIELQEESKSLEESQIKGIVNKYVLFKENENSKVDVSLLYENNTNNEVTSIKLGNVIFNFKTCLQDIIGIGVNINNIKFDSGNILLTNIVLILKILLKFKKLITIKLDENHAYIISVLYTNNAHKYDMSIDELKLICKENMKNIDKKDIDNILDDLVKLQCITIVEEKVKIKETIINDWIK